MYLKPAKIKICSYLERIEPRGMRHGSGGRSDDTQHGAALRRFCHGRAEVMIFDSVQSLE